MRIKKGHEERARNAIINILSANRGLANALNVVSFVNDGIVFTAGSNLPINIWGSQFMKYLRVVIPHSGYTINFKNPYKSEEFKDVTEFEIYKGDLFIEGKTCNNKELAELTAYMEVLTGMRVYFKGKANFDSIYQEYFTKVEHIIDMLPMHDFRTPKTSSGYKVSDDLKEILDDKALFRQYKLSLINI